MKLDYFSLLSPEPIYIPKIGHIKSPTLREISQIGYEQYNLFIGLLMLSVEKYFKIYDVDKIEWYESLNDEEKSKINIYNLIVKNNELLFLLFHTLNFFFKDIVLFNDKIEKFIIYESESAINNNAKLIGMISADNFNDVRNFILQRNYIFNKFEDDFKKVKNKRALKILQKLKKGKEQFNKNKKNNKKNELPNIISAVSCYHNNLNISNIWDITVFQLYDQFVRMQNKFVYDINFRNYSIWGGKDNEFDISSWYNTID